MTSCLAEAVPDARSEAGLMPAGAPTSPLRPEANLLLALVICCSNVGIKVDLGDLT